MRVRINLEELKAAIGELEARTKEDKVTLEIEDGRNLIVSCVDRYENGLEVKLYQDTSLGAQFKYTERLMHMKEKKRV